MRCLLRGVMLALGIGCHDPVTTPDPGDPLPPPDTAAPRLQRIAGALDRPLYVTAPPTDSSRLFIVLQGGAIRIVRRDTLRPTPFLDLGAAVSCCGERGLLGLAFSPDYAASGRFYVNFTNASGDTRVVRYRATTAEVADPLSAETLLAVPQPFANHNGGWLGFGPDGYLYVALGDGGSAGDPLDHAQNLGSLLGKILRLDVAGAGPYAIPPDNPFAAGGGRAEIWAAGLRNPWRLAFDRGSGDLWIGDVGQGQREEINRLPWPGGFTNFGWRPMEGTRCFVAGCDPAAWTLPIHEYTHADGCSITGGHVYRGARLPALRGHYFYADYCAGWIRSLLWQPAGAGGHRIWPTLAPGGPIASFGEDASGELYVVEHGTAGAVYRVAPAATAPAPRGRSAPVPPRAPPGTLRRDLPVRGATPR